MMENTQKAFLIGTYAQKEKEVCLEQLDELKSLVKTYGAETVYSIACPMRQIDPSTFLGKGKVEEIKALVEETNPDLLIFDDEIAPRQQRQLEAVLKKPVIDRSELILAVFAKRAKTKEAKIQVELATMQYQLPRLRRLWTHLHRQRASGSGGGAVKGEGEKQIELDKRMIRKQIQKLEKELKNIQEQRALQRKKRFRTKIPTFALIGYTNAGKSTLFEALTKTDVFREDLLFATLDPTTRQFVLPGQEKVLITDTVGFIRKIPHFLIAAFRSTLEEAVFADVLIHVIDVSHKDADQQADTTLSVLKELKASHLPILTVFNKIDQTADVKTFLKLKVKHPKRIEVSALQKKGIDILAKKMGEELQKLRKPILLKIPQEEYPLVLKIEKEGKVLSVEYEENEIWIMAEISEILEKKLTPFIQI